MQPDILVPGLEPDSIPTPSSFTGDSPETDDLSLVLAEWEQLNREEPWHIAPQRYGPDRLHETIRAVLDIATWSDSDAYAPERLVRAAVAHGEQRRAQGVDDGALLREYHALRGALWRFLQHDPNQGPATIAAILRVDVAIGVATIVALRGYHRSDRAIGGSWEEEMLKEVGAVSRHLADHLQDRSAS